MNKKDLITNICAILVGISIVLPQIFPQYTSLAEFVITVSVAVVAFLTGKDPKDVNKIFEKANKK